MRFDVSFVVSRGTPKVKPLETQVFNSDLTVSRSLHPVVGWQNRIKSSTSSSGSA
jgi:hypothetical protein